MGSEASDQGVAINGKRVFVENDVTKKISCIALKYANHFDKNSKLDPRHDMQELRWGDLNVGKLLGTGGFSEVHEVKLVRNGQHDASEQKFYDAVEDSEHTDSTPSLACSSDDDEAEESTTSTETYAIKYLKPAVLRKEKPFKAGLIDLVIEGKILSLLDHENIIKVHATPSFCVSRAFMGDNCGYFLVLDSLVGTVSDRMSQWQIEDMKARARTFRPSLTKGRPALMTGGTGPTSEHRRLQLGRLNDVVLPVVNAMKYLHSKNVIFRDLKPSNIGFDASGKIKLFDFGLAREIINPERRMTGNTGSLRYMAPEVARREHYGLKVDVHSFGIFLWEMCTLKTPYDGMTRSLYIECVVYGKMRPTLDSTCGSREIQLMIEQCWSNSPDVRPTYEEICVDLEREVAKIPSLDKALRKSRLYNNNADSIAKAKVRTSSAA